LIYLFGLPTQQISSEPNKTQINANDAHMLSRSALSLDGDNQSSDKSIEQESIPKDVSRQKPYTGP